MTETAKPPKSVRQALRRYEDEAKQWRKLQDGAGQWWIRNDAQHVNPDMTGWEEKNGYVTFRLVRQDATGAYFEGLTFRRATPDRIDGFIALRDKASGTVREETLTYRRVK